MARLTASSSVCLAFLLAVVCLPRLSPAASTAASASGPEKGSQPDLALPAPDQWKEIQEVPARVEVLRFLAAQARGNYERIRTWQASYRFRHLGPVSQAVLQPPGGHNPPKPAGSAVVCERHFLVDFVVDQSRNAIYKDKRATKYEFRDARSGQPLKLPWLSVSTGRTILTPDEWLEFSPDSLVTVPELGRQDVQPVAYRNPRETLPRWDRHFDLRNLFADALRQPIWEYLEVDVRVFNGEQGEKMKSHWEKHCRLRQAQTGQGTWFQREMASELPSGELSIDRRIFSPMANHLPIEAVVLRGAPTAGSQLQVESRLSWRYKQVSGVYVPSHFEDLNRVGMLGTGSQWEWEYDLLSCRVNKPVDPAQFTWAALKRRKERRCGTGWRGSCMCGGKASSTRRPRRRRLGGERR